MTSETEPEFFGPFNMTAMKASLADAEKLANAAMLTPPAARRRLAARKVEMATRFVDPAYIPPKDVLMYLVRMGSFSSTPKIENTDSADNDIIPSFTTCELSELLNRCRFQLTSSNRPCVIPRRMRSIRTVEEKESTIRVLQWNTLSQSLGTAHDNFVQCPKEAFEWPYRRYQILEEIIQYDPDIICLQEVDHFALLEAALGSIGYEGKFTPKPDSPCVYLENNNGPDGCALFFKKSRFELLTSKSRILQVWRVQSNQVSVAFVLKDLIEGRELCVATTHLKAKSGALLATLRDNQGKDLLDWLYDIAGGRPTILSGDFNAEPGEPVYRTTTNHRLHLRSAYCEEAGEPPYTTWKFREEGEVCHTIDYIFHSSTLKVAALLDFPTESELGPGRAPSMSYPSDHFSLVADITY